MSWELQTSFALGVLHSLEPGHGKTAMLAMMLDPEKKWWDSFALAISAVFSHSILIFAVATLTHFGGHLVFGEKIDQFLVEHLKFFGSLSLIAIGLFLVLSSKKRTAKWCDGHNHEHEGSSNIPILLGVSIGFYPCPSLVATFLASVSTGQLNLGMTTVALFALGSFVSILASAVVLRWLGARFVTQLAARSLEFNWRRVQGAVVLLVGAVSLATS